MKGWVLINSPPPELTARVRLGRVGLRLGIVVGLRLGLGLGSGLGLVLALGLRRMFRVRVN